MTLTQLQDLGWIEVAADTEYFVAASTKVDSKWIELGYDTTTTYLHVLKVREYPPGTKIRETIYNGKCSDLQTFKYLQTLLGI